MPTENEIRQKIAVELARYIYDENTPHDMGCTLTYWRSGNPLDGDLKNDYCDCQLMECLSIVAPEEI